MYRNLVRNRIEKNKQEESIRLTHMKSCNRHFVLL